MRNTVFNTVVFNFIGFIFLVFSPDSWAIVGERWNVSLNINSQFTSLSKRLFLSDGYTVYLYGDESTLMISEYVNLDGVVFAAKWTGLYLPSLEKILSSEYRNIISNFGIKFNSKMVSVNKDGFVYLSAGKMRSFNGYAYDSNLAPVKFNFDILK